MLKWGDSYPLLLSPVYLKVVFMLWFSLAALFILIDQVSKIMIQSDAFLTEGGRYTLIDGFFHIRYVINRGAAFSFLSDTDWGIYVLTGISLIVSILVIYVLWRQRHGMKLFSFTLALILGGTVGNLIDRIRLGGVIDFLDFQFGSWHFPTFNVADSCLTIGGLLLIVLFLTSGERLERELEHPTKVQVHDEA